MSNTTVKELHCKMCYQKFCGGNRLIHAFFHLKNQHPGIFQRQYKKKQTKDGVDICSPEVSSSLPSPDPALSETNVTHAASHPVVKKQADQSTSGNQPVLYPVPGQMKIYFSLNDPTSYKPYKCNRCGRKLTNLKMCVVHLLKDHNIPLKQSRGCSPSGATGDVSTSTDPLHPCKKKQTARKSIGSCPAVSASSPSRNDGPNKENTNRVRLTAVRSKKKVTHKSGNKVVALRKVSVLSLKRKTERKRIMKIKLALMRQRHNHMLLEQPDDVEAGACSLEDCFDSLSGSQENNEEGVLDDEAALLENCDTMAEIEYTTSSPSGEGETERSSENSTLSSASQRSNEKSNSSRDESKHDSLWNSIYWNSTQSLTCSKASSNVTSVKKASSSAECPTSVSERTSAVISTVEPAIPQCGTAMLKQLRTNSSNSHKSVGKSKSLGNDSKQRSESPFNALSSDDYPRENGKKKSARKTTRPVKIRGELLQNNELISVLSYIHSNENKQCFSKNDNIKSTQFPSTASQGSRSAYQDVSEPSSSSPLSNPSPLCSSSLRAQSTLSDVSSSQSTSPRSSSSQQHLLSHFFPADHAGMSMVSSSTPKRATGRKSFRSKPPT